MSSRHLSKCAPLIAATLAMLVAGCSTLAGGGLADWEPAPGQSVDSETTTLGILVRERACASGHDAEGRIDDPEIAYLEEAVVVTVRVRPRSGGQDCQGDPTTPYTLELREPLGDRQLLEGGDGEPTTPDVDG